MSWSKKEMSQERDACFSPSWQRHVYWPRQARQRVAAADSVVQRRGAYRSSKRLAGDVIVRLISTVDSAGILLGTKVDLSDGDHVRGDLAIHCCADGDNVCCCHARSDDSGYLSEKL